MKIYKLLMPKLLFLPFFLISIIFLPYNFANASEVVPISPSVLAKSAAIQGVSISLEGDFMTALITPEGESKLALATWNLNDLNQAPKISRAPDDVDFIRARALKSGKIFLTTRKKWTGNTGTCGLEGKSIGTTKTYINKVFIVDKNLKKFDELSLGSRTLRQSESRKFCAEIFGDTTMLSSLPKDKDNIIVRVRNNNSQVYDYYEYNFKKKKSKFLFKRTFEQRQIAYFDEIEKTYTAETEIDTKDGNYIKTIYVKNPKTGEFNTNDNLKLDLINTRMDIRIVDYDRKNKKFLVSTDKFSEYFEIYTLDPETLEFSDKPLFSNDKFSIVEVFTGQLNENYGEIIGYRLNRDIQDDVYIDDIFKPIKDSIKSSFPGKNIDIVDFDINLKHFLFTVGNSDYPTEYYILLDKKKAVKIGSSYPWLLNETLSKEEFFYYTARDGLEIPAYIAYPKGFEKGKEKVKAVIHPHGGPWQRDYSGYYDSFVQFFTSRGFAVLRPQFRGSAGFSRKLWVDGDKNWGLKMQDDKDDAAKWLVDQGISNPEDIMIMGYSYGGYASIAASVRKEKFFRCSIAGAGPSDIKKLSTTFFSASRFQRIFQGRTLSGLNPIEETDNLKMPILLFTGDRDVRVLPFHSENFYARIKNNKDTKLVIIKDMPHSYPWTRDMREQVFQIMDDFLYDENGCNYKR